MAINPHWLRWTVASIATHFNAAKGAYPLYLEGDERDTDELKNFAELRIDGPFVKTLQGGLFYLDIEVNVLIQSKMDPENLYLGLTVAGVFAAAFVNVIKAYKYGTGNDDDDTLLGCYRLRDTRNDNSIDISQFGIIQKDTRLTQITIEGHYRMELQT